MFAHPHGIWLAPRHDAGDATWSYSLAVDSPAWYAASARMAIALDEHDVPFAFDRWQRVYDALLGSDDVDIGTGGLALTYEELRERRPDAVDHIRWDPTPQLGPITPEQLQRVSRADLSG